MVLETLLEAIVSQYRNACAAWQCIWKDFSDASDVQLFGRDQIKGYRNSGKQYTPREELSSLKTFLKYIFPKYF